MPPARWDLHLRISGQTFAHSVVLRTVPLTRIYMSFGNMFLNIWKSCKMIRNSQFIRNGSKVINRNCCLHPLLPFFKCFHRSQGFTFADGS